MFEHNIVCADELDEFERIKSESEKGIASENGIISLLSITNPLNPFLLKISRKELYESIKASLSYPEDYQ